MKSDRLVFFLLTIIIIGSGTALAQSDSSFSKPKYFYSIHSGALLAKKENANSLSAFTIHGIRMKRLAVGIGMGYDTYMGWQTLPLFGSISFDVGTSKNTNAHKKRNAMFLQFNAGYSNAWITPVENNGVSYKEHGGSMIHPLIGYRINADRFSLYVTAGYKIQNVRYEQTPDWWHRGWTTYKSSVDRKIERLSIQLGFGLH